MHGPYIWLSSMFHDTQLLYVYSCYYVKDSLYSFATANEEFDNGLCDVCNVNSFSKNLTYCLYLSILILSLILQMIISSIGIIPNLILLWIMKRMKKKMVICKKLVGQFVSHSPCIDFRFGYPAYFMILSCYMFTVGFTQEICGCHYVKLSFKIFLVNLGV